MKSLCKYSCVFFILANLFLFPSFGFSHTALKREAAKSVTKTKWDLVPSFKLDVICFLNTLTGDPFYLDFYKEEYAKFEPKLTPEARTALADLKRKIKDEKQGIISATLAINFSATDDKTLDDMLKTLKDSSKMQDNLRKTPYYNDEDWKLYESVRPDLKVIFQFLKKIKFNAYWKTDILPKVNKRISEIQNELPQFDVVSEVEGHLGFKLPSDQITVYVLYYTKPHGIKVTGMRFLTDEAWPIKIVVRNAGHEMMHPPYDLKNDKELADLLNSLKNDEFIMDKVENHDPSFGYNTFEGLVEEDTVQAIEQLINEKFKIENEAHKKWKESDNGIHVFAVALYSVMKQENFPQNHETFRNFLVRMIETGKLATGNIKPTYDSFYATVAGN
jgi:hypothetical protein